MISSQRVDKYYKSNYITHTTTRAEIIRDCLSRYVITSLILTTVLIMSGKMRNFDISIF